MKRSGYGIALIAGLLTLVLLAACGGGQPAPQTPADIDRVATRVAEDLAVAATLTALAPRSAPTATDTLTPERPVPATEPPTPEAQPEATAEPTATPTVPPPRPSPAGPSCRVAAAGLNLRSGPGAVFAPPIGGLAQNTELRPLSFVARGFPAGQWIEVQVVATGRRGWVSADAQFVTCNMDVKRLPAGKSPATPTPTRVIPTVVPVLTPTRVQVVIVPIDGGDNNNLRNGRTVKGGRNVLLPGFTGPSTNPVTFSDGIVFQVEVFDSTVSQYDGAGIQDVQFFISDGFGEVHRRTERTPGYCVFGGGEPDCTVWRFSEHNNRWPDGAELHKGQHNAQIVITAKSGESAIWNWTFIIE